MSNLFQSYFDTLTTDRKSTSPAKNQPQQPRPPPKKLSKAFTRQLAKTLATPKKPLKKKTTKRKRPLPAKMPKRAAAQSYDSDNGFVEDAPRSKKTKASNNRNTVKGELPTKETDPKDGSVFWTIASKRRLQLSEFKGTTMVGVREYYEKDGEMLPGKKGISMTLEQFNMVVELLPQLEGECKSKGVRLARPRYGGVAAGGGEEDDGEEDVEEEKEKEDEKVDDDEEVEEETVPKKTKSKLDKFKHKAKNHEATSDEDEG
ncbi:putative transcriptional coactivator p15 (PC4), ssDNA-binding transcriptional regulator [Septoria linicola]|nr:putative transcriptional coactivator p15 (PC4), ssDNA-binding transcriptional regulator [Septoria linicola]